MSDLRSSGRNPFVVGIVAFLVGALYGAVGTIGHRHQLRVGELVIPWGIAAALIGVAALLVGLRLLLPGRLAAAAAGVGVIGVVALLSLPGLGGTILIPATIEGTVWAVAPAVIGVLVVAWPTMSTLRRTTTHAASGDPAAA
ncbi:hypothetical protein ABIQ69_06110 [Agromyces sp. G08B096]|uniref:Histidinol dehydrogenase n=1 Tax=Agromyces sp. G08B096 TaxID=3156399 RepID=A0AAU7WDH6_9MICO